MGKKKLSQEDIADQLFDMMNNNSSANFLNNKKSKDTVTESSILDDLMSHHQYEKKQKNNHHKKKVKDESGRDLLGPIDMIDKVPSTPVNVKTDSGKEYEEEFKDIITFKDIIGKEEKFKHDAKTEKVTNNQGRQYDIKIDDVDLRSITCKDLLRVKKLIIDDDVAPVSINLNIIDSKDELPVEVDSDHVYAFVQSLMDYLIILKYPSAIYTVDEFRDNFDTVAEHSNNYRFYKDDDSIIAYLVDDSFNNTFNKLFDQLGDYRDVLKYIVYIIKQCENSHNRWFHDNYDDVDNIRKFTKLNDFTYKFMKEGVINTDDSITADDFIDSLDFFIDVLREGMESMFILQGEYSLDDIYDVIESHKAESTDEDELEVEFANEETDDEVSENIEEVIEEPSEEVKDVEEESPKQLEEVEDINNVDLDEILSEDKPGEDDDDSMIIDVIGKND